MGPQPRAGVRVRLAALLAGLVVLAVSAGGGTAVAALPGTDDAEDRAAWRALLQWPAACEADWRAAGNETAGVTTWKASGGRTLVSVACSMGAYQGTHRLHLVGRDGTPSKALRLHLYRDTGSGKPKPVRTTQVLGTLSFTTRTSRLELLDRFRGVGDCGIRSVFRLSGSRLIPVSTRAKTACDGRPPYDPATWPKLRTLRP